MRLSPRDLNWTDSEGKHLCCIIRPELISHYITSKTFQEASESVKKDMDAKKDAEKKEEVKDGDTTKEPEGEKPDLDYTEYVNKIQEYILNPMNKNKIKFNSSIETRVKLVDSPKLEGNFTNSLYKAPRAKEGSQGIGPIYWIPSHPHFNQRINQWRYYSSS
jgi:hypothetical protein